MTELLINGEWVPAEGASTHDLIDPTNRKPLAVIQCASPAQRQRALEAARAAFDGWKGHPVADRATLVGEISDEIWQAGGALAERQVIESGQPLRECQDLVANAVRRLRRRQSGLSMEPNQESSCARTLRLPRFGLWPFWEDALTWISAGATLVCEVPADQPLAALAVARCSRRLPPGVLNVVTVEPDGEASPQNEVATEFVYVGEDADIDVAVAGAAALRLYNSGQRAGQSVRIHVAAALAYRFADRLHEHLAFLEAGDPRKSATDLGPIRCEAALQRAIQQIGDGLKQGALVKLGGRPYQPWGLTGFFLQPTLLIEGSGAERTPHEAISAPVVIVSPTTDFGAALRESAGATHSPLRVTAFTGELRKLERSLRAASFEPRAGGYTPLVDRSWPETLESGTDHGRGWVSLELIAKRQADWFPYKERRGMKL